MAATILSDKQLSNSAYSHVINAPIEKVVIAAWLFSLPEAEYGRCCPPDHITCGTTSTDDGTSMSINRTKVFRPRDHVIPISAAVLRYPRGGHVGIPN